ncbi:MAG: replication-relaxation family protein [Terriglobia bacterium]|nr:replication-relaxation family protein [Terriglobia bacterium]
MTAPASKRLPRYRRAPEDLSCSLTLRDLEILGVTESFRLVTSEHIQALTAGSGQGVLRRLQKLFHAGYLDRLQPRAPYGSGSAKMVYAITNKGIRTLEESGELKRRSSTDWNAQNRTLHDFSIRHTLLVSEIRAAVTAASRHNPGLKLLYWKEGRQLYDSVEVALPDGYAHIPVAPDAFFGLQDAQGKMHFFLEADRGTMTLKRFVRKLKAYAAYHRQKRQQDKFGIRYFRVLTVTSSVERAGNLAKAAKAEDDIRQLGRMFLFTSDDGLSLSDPESISKKIWSSLESPDRCSILGETETIPAKEGKPYELRNNPYHRGIQ